MTRPGTLITVSDLAQPRGASVDTGRVFVTGGAVKGRVGEAVLVRDMGSSEVEYGPRSATYGLWDWLDVFFRDGGTEAYVSRVVGAAPVRGSANLAPSNSISATAKGPGAYSNTLSVRIDAGPTTGVVLTILMGGVTPVYVSPELFVKADVTNLNHLQNWLNFSDAGAGGMPIPQAAVTLGAGTDDWTNASDATWNAALAAFTDELGPGQVVHTGRTGTVTGSGLLGHAAAHNRFAVLDAPNPATGILTPELALSAAGGVGDDPNARYGGIWGPWVIVPGVVANTQRTVPASAVVCAAIARQDARVGPGQAAAGVFGRSSFSVALGGSFSDTDRAPLTDAGFNTLRFMFGEVRVYGFRTLADPNALPEWLQANGVRVVMDVVARAGVIAESHLFATIDGQGIEFSAFAGDLTGMLSDLYNAGALFGDTPAAAFRVDVGSSVNTPATIADGQLRATIAIRTSPFAELVVVNIIKVAASEVLPT